jgi:RimJ/RimL family protein N-acetyltransferase
MLSSLKSAVKLDHMLKLSLPVASREEPERKPVLLRKRDIPMLCSRLPNRRPGQLEERLGAGDRCYAIRNGAGEVVSLVWVALGRTVYVYELGDSIWVPEDVAYLYDAFTFPEARGRHLIAQITSGVVNDLKASSIRRCEVWISRNNKASLRAFRRAGFEVCGAWRVAGLGPVRLCSGEPWI